MKQMEKCPQCGGDKFIIRDCYTESDMLIDPEHLDSKNVITYFHWNDSSVVECNSTPNCWVGTYAQYSGVPEVHRKTLRSLLEALLSNQPTQEDLLLLGMFLKRPCDRHFDKIMVPSQEDQKKCEWMEEYDKEWSRQRNIAVNGVTEEPEPEPALQKVTEPGTEGAGKV